MGRKTGQRWLFKRNNDHGLNEFVEWVKLQWVAGKSPNFHVVEADRSTDQNALWNGLYGDIARQSDDSSVLDVRRHCKLHYGIGILKAADPEFATWYDQAIKPMSYEAKLMLMTYMDVTSKFNKSQGSEYISTIIKEYTQMGYALATPQ